MSISNKFLTKRSAFRVSPRTFSYLLIGLLLTQPGLAENCTNPYKGQKLQRQQVIELIAKAKQQAINLCGTDLSNVDLSKLDLKKINLYGSDLSYSNLQYSNLSNANLTKTFFRWAKLNHAIFFNANLQAANLQDTSATNSDFRQANLTKANFIQANISQANFSGAQLPAAKFNHSKANHTIFTWTDLTNANFEASQLINTDFSNATLRQTNFTEANLEQANFTQAKLQRVNFNKSQLGDSNFFQADLYKTIYQPQLGQIPNIILLATSKNFRTLQFDRHFGASALAELRNAYRKIDMRSMDRQITAMLKINDMRLAWHSGGWGYVESFFSYLLFYLSCDYGADPGRPLQLLIALVLLLSIPYAIAVYHPNRHHGIMVIWPINRFYHWNKSSLKEPPKELQRLLTATAKPTLLGSGREILRIWRIAIFFSILSTFQIGWRELNVSNWISRLQSRRYRLSGKGWVRVLAGSQSLLSAYLIVLWALTYFGRPFEW